MNIYVKKIALALLLFGSLASGVLFFLTRYVAEKKPTSLVYKPKVKPATTMDAKQPLFYRTIGETKVASKKNNSKSGTYTVEVMVTTDKERAQSVVQDLKKANIQAFFSAYNDGGLIVFKVRTGLFTSPVEADRHLKKIANQKYQGLKVRKL